MARWRNDAPKEVRNKDKINPLSWINGSMRVGQSTEATSAFRLTWAAF
jgi:hypothetical protein